MAAKPSYETITAHDGSPIRTVRFEPDIRPVGVTQVLHGFSEGIDHYGEIAEFFTHAGFVCVIYDQRGLPDTPKQKQTQGVIPGYEFFLEDVKTVRNKIDRWYPALPVILFGFSMGGNVAINYLLKYSQEQFEKVILVSPWLRLCRTLSGFAKIFTRFTGKAGYKKAVSAVKFKRKYLSRNEGKTKRAIDYKIFYSRFSYRLVTEMNNAGEYAIQNAACINVPVLLLCAGKDRIVSPKAIKEFSGNTHENVTFIEYPDAYHYLHHDNIGSEVMGAILSFCKRQPL